MTGTFARACEADALVLTQRFCSEYVIQEDMTKAARKVGEAKKHESKKCPLCFDVCPLLTSHSLSQARVFCIVGIDAFALGRVLYHTMHSVLGLLYMVSTSSECNHALQHHCGSIVQFEEVKTCIYPCTIDG